MQLKTKYLVVVGAVIIAAACSTDRSLQPSDAASGIRKNVGTPTCATNAAIKKEIQALFPADSVGPATSLFSHATNAYNQGDVATARALAAQFYQYAKKLYDAGLLVGAGTPAGAAAVAQLGNDVFCSVGMNVNLSPALDDNVVVVVSPGKDTTVRTGTSHAGVQLFAGQQLPQEVVIITRLPDNAHTATCPQYSGPLCTPLAQFPPFYDYQLSPAPQLGQNAPPFNVEECVDTTQVHVPVAQLYIAHNIGPDTAQVLPHMPNGNLSLACDQGLGMGQQRSLYELARNGRVGPLAAELASRVGDFLVPNAYALFGSSGVTGQTRSFSPFGIVDVNDLVPYRNGQWTYHVPAFSGIPATPDVGDIAGFEQPGFNPDNSWVSNASAFGDAPFGSTANVSCTLNMLPYLNTAWPSFSQPTSSPPPDLQVSTIFLLRQTFFVPSSWSQDLQVGVAIDNDVEVFINGVPVSAGGNPVFDVHEGCASQDSFVYPVPKSMLVLGQPNLIAIRARDRGGNSYADVRVSPTTPLTP